MKRSPLRPVSEKRLAEREARAEVREATLRRAGFRCQAPGAFGIRCGGVLDCHELQSRAARPGGHLDIDNTIMLCRRHHDHVTEHPSDAHDAGLVRWSWE